MSQGSPGGGTEQGRTKHAWRKSCHFNDVASANAKLQDVLVLSTVGHSRARRLGTIASSATLCRFPTRVSRALNVRGFQRGGTTGDRAPRVTARRLLAARPPMHVSCSRFAFLVYAAFGIGCLCACGSSGADNADGGGSGDATASPSGDATGADGQGDLDQSSPRDGTMDASADSAAPSEGDSGRDSAVDAGTDASRDVGVDSARDAATDSSDAAAEATTPVACEGGAPLPIDAGQPAVHLCSYPDGGANFPLFDKCCVSNVDCTIGLWEFSCCGDRLAVGFNTSQTSAFQAALAGWSCAACGCAGQGLHTEDGVAGVTDAGVKCENRWCVTYAR
jgi:hypothetical protein